MKKLIAFLLCLTMLLSFVSCFGSKEGDETTTPDPVVPEPTPVPITGPDFVYNDELTLSLTDAFKQVKKDGYAACYVTEGITVYVIREELSTLSPEQANMSSVEYAEQVRYNNSFNNPGNVSTANRLVSIECTYAPEKGADPTHKALFTMFKSSKAFWTIQFSCAYDDYRENSRSFIKWAQAIRFIEEAKDFTHDDLTVKLDESYKQVAVPDRTDATAQFASDRYNVYVIKDTTTKAASLSTYEDRIDSQYNKTYGTSGVVDKTPDNYEEALKGIGTLTYTEGGTFYLVTMYKGKDAYWQVLFSCAKNQEADMRETFITYAKSVTLAQ